MTFTNLETVIWAWRLANQPSRGVYVPSARAEDLDISIFLGHQWPCPLPGPANISDMSGDEVRNVGKKYPLGPLSEEARLPREHRPRPVQQLARVSAWWQQAG